MKRFLSLALVLFLCACGPASPADTPFALENPNGDRLALGMSQTELDALLTPEEGKDLGDVWAATGIMSEMAIGYMHARAK